MTANPYAAPDTQTHGRPDVDHGTLGILGLGFLGAVILFTIGAANSPEPIITNSFAAICATIVGIPIFGFALIRPFRRTRSLAVVASFVAGTATAFGTVGLVALQDFLYGNTFSGLAWWWASRFAVAACLGAIGGFVGALLGVAAFRRSRKLRPNGVAT